MFSDLQSCCGLNILWTHTNQFTRLFCCTILVTEFSLKYFLINFNIYSVKTTESSQIQL